MFLFQCTLLVHPSVLVETFEQGESVSCYVDELEGQERVESSLAHTGTRALLKMLLVNIVIHLIHACVYFYSSSKSW